jgi:hypothetical protein
VKSKRAAHRESEGTNAAHPRKSWSPATLWKHPTTRSTTPSILRGSLGASVSVVHVYQPLFDSFPDAVLVAPPEMAAEISDKSQRMLDDAVNSGRQRCSAIDGVLLGEAS